MPGSDANPYLAIAASLACGYLGIKNDLKPDAPRSGYSSDGPHTLPRGLTEALKLFDECDELADVFGERFVATYRAIKQEEYETFMSVISAWEREYLLLNV